MSNLFFFFFLNKNPEEEKVPAEATCLASWEGLRGLLIYLVTEFSMLHKFCCFVTATLWLVCILSNALDLSLLLHFWVWCPVGGLFWIFSNLEAIEQQSFHPL